MKEQNSIKAAFFDIDGTLYDHQAHQIPDKHQRMLELLHQKGIKVCLCTGRALPLLENLKILSLFPWDGIVAGNGSYVYDQDLHPLFEDPISKKSADAIFKLASKENIGIFAAGNCALITQEDPITLELLHKVSCVNIPCRAPKKEDAFCILSLCVEDTQAKRRDYESIPNVQVLYNLLSVDIMKKGLSKYHGIRLLMLHFGFDPRAYMAFGDALNDLEMLQHASLAGAMEDGDPRILAKISNHVPSVKVGGIYDFLKERGIL
ncbi:HAD hydrolase family protein [Dubosiella newyorkensis]|uniref:HAD hydrolase family protein n=1 Tax=Dubosiella newyorkensis TaxID=1862672 RepID=UPI00272A1576|nr:HAD hydrolase family protein [Dubosiella newyorkensis]